MNIEPRHFLYLYLTCITLISSLGCRESVIPQIVADQKNVQHMESWKPLEAFPQKSGRNDDIFFISPDKGWTINNGGELYHTEDGGTSWTLQFQRKNSYFRCLAFKDSLTGWIGTIGQDSVRYPWVEDSVVFYQTKNGGNSWEPVNIPEPYPTGLCGLQVVSDKVIVGCGRVRGPSYFIKSSDGGQTWVSKDMNHMAQMLIAPYFFDEKNGIMIGGTAFEFEESRGIILSTADGGDTWDTLYVTPQKGEYCWKISFPTREIGYISVQRNVDDGRYYFLKTTDGGKTWEEKDFTSEKYFVQGIGFLNKDIGWIGGGYAYTYETRDGGESWRRIVPGKFLNKFWFVNDTVGYASGSPVYKFDQLKSPPDGAVIRYHDNGEIASRRHFDKGVLYGISQTYYPSGHIKSEGSYFNNVRTGIWTFYDTHGDEERVRYKNDITRVPNGLLKKYEGVYKSENGRTIWIKRKGSYLQYIRLDANFKSNIYAERRDQFFFENYKHLHVKFFQNKNDHVTKLEINGGNTPLILKKLSSKEAQKILEEHN